MNFPGQAKNLFFWKIRGIVVVSTENGGSDTLIPVVENEKAIPDKVIPRIKSSNIQDSNEGIRQNDGRAVSFQIGSTDGRKSYADVVKGSMSK